MSRDAKIQERTARVAALRTRAFDVLIVGGGIHGATLANAAARAGLKVALIEKGDYGVGASANSLKILHGGLRYLQQFNFSRMRESIAARKDGLTSLPYLARPARFLAPTGRSLKRSLAAYGVAALVNDLVSHDRNRGVPVLQQIPPTRVLTRAKLAELLPGVSLPGSGALLWGDGFVHDTERYTLAYAMSAFDNGAVTANYVRAVHLLREGGKVVGVKAMDVEKQAEFDIRARITVCTSGGWLNEFMDLPGLNPPETTWVRAYNIVVRKRWFGEFGVGLDAPAQKGRPGRNFFFMPWRGGTIIGTVYKPFAGSADACALKSEDIAEFVTEINELYPPANLSVRDVTFAHVGILPGQKSGDGSAPSPSGTTRVIDARSANVEGLLFLQGVKYTTAAYWANRVTGMIAERLKHSIPFVPALDIAPLYGAEEHVFDEEIVQAAFSVGWEISDAMVAWLSNHYGARYREVIEISRENKLLREAAGSEPIPLAAAVHAMRREDARTLSDIVFRRTGLGSFEYPGRDALVKVAATVGRFYGWDEGRQASEVENVTQHYRNLGLTVES